jgi:hypothetical protein
MAEESRRAAEAERDAARAQAIGEREGAARAEGEQDALQKPYVLICVEI